MDFNDSQEYSQQSRVVASSNYPTTYLDLFSKPGATSPETPELAIPVGSSIYLFIKVIEIMMRDGKSIGGYALRSKKLRYFRRMV
jgi:hypothetical protein